MVLTVYIIKFKRLRIKELSTLLGNNPKKAKETIKIRIDVNEIETKRNRRTRNVRAHYWKRREAGSAGVTGATGSSERPGHCPL